MPHEDTSIRITKDGKQILDAARNAWEEEHARRVTAGEFVHILAARYLVQSGRKPPSKGKGGGQIAAQEVKPVQPKQVTPGPQVFLVDCYRCGGKIAWQLDLGIEGGCPYCGAWLKLSI